MTLQNKLKKLYEALNSLPCDVRHYRRQASYPYLVWAEEGEDGDFFSDNRREQVITGSADYFTREEFDPVCDGIQEVLERVCAGWSLEAVQYEEETNLIHYTWSWAVV